MTYASEASPDTPDDPRIPVTLLTGFLGAGKTTLLNRILKDASYGPIAVIVNEFGETGLDHEMIETMDPDTDIMLMPSGCLCCSIRGDLSNTFVKLLAKHDRGMLNFDRVVIETTGLADPGPILQTLLVDPFLGRNTRMDGIVTVVDAANGLATLDAQAEAVSQVAMADLLLLSKTDLVSEAKSDAIAERVRSINATADILHTLAPEFSPAKLQNLTSMRQDALTSDAIAWTTPKDTGSDHAAHPSEANASDDHHHGHSQDHDHHHHHHHDDDHDHGHHHHHDHDGISSMSIILDEPLDDVVFDKWFDALIAHKGDDILRVKGILFLRGIDTPFAFHGVQHIFDPPVPLKNWTGDDRRTRIVLIGRNLNQSEIRSSLELLRLGQAQNSTDEMADMEL